MWEIELKDNREICAVVGEKDIDHHMLFRDFPPLTDLLVAFPTKEVVHVLAR